MIFTNRRKTMKKRKPIYIIYYYVSNPDGTYTEFKQVYKSKHLARSTYNQLASDPSIMSIDMEVVY